MSRTFRRTVLIDAIDYGLKLRLADQQFRNLRKAIGKRVKIDRIKPQTREDRNKVEIWTY